MEVTSDELRLVGLDGFRLALQRMHDQFVLPDGVDKVTAIIPGRVMNEIAHIMEDDDGMATFHLDSTHLMGRDGQYPRWSPAFWPGNTSTIARFCRRPGSRG